MKLSLRNRIIIGVVVLAIVAGVVIRVIVGSKSTTSGTSPGVITTTVPSSAPSPTVRPGSTETVIDISSEDPLLPYLSPGVHIDVLKLTPNGSGGQTAQVIATDLVIVGVQASGINGNTPPAIQTAVPAAIPGAAPNSVPVATPAPLSAGLVVDVPTSEEGALLPAQSGYANIAYVIVGASATPAATAAPTAVPTQAPTATATPVPSPSSTAAPPTPTGT